jgi:MraZ protein
MGRFKGQEVYSIDNKGRVAIPMKMRKLVSPDAKDTFTLTRGFDKCIHLFPNDEWEQFAAQFDEVDVYSKEGRFFLDIINSWSEESTLDSQQRISIPKRLLDYAGIQKDAMFIGMNKYIAIWNPEEHEKYISALDTSYEEIAQKVMSKGKNE